LRRAEQTFYLNAERVRKQAQVIKLSYASHGYLQVTDAAFGICAFQSAYGALGQVAQTHGRVYDEVIYSAVGIEVNREYVGMLVSFAQARACFASAGEFRTVDTMSVCSKSYDCCM